jgi:hypothetical protein
MSVGFYEHSYAIRFDVEDTQRPWTHYCKVIITQVITRPPFLSSANLYQN